MLPIGVRAESVTVLIVGGGAVGLRKAEAFLEAGAVVRIVEPSPTDELRAPRPRLDLLERVFEETDLEDADLVVAATADPAVNARVVSAARARGLLVNRVDAPGEGNFDTLAVHRAGPLAIGIAAGVPGAAARIRDAIAARFDTRYAAALTDLAQLRDRLRARGQWSAAAAELTGADFCDLVESDALRQRVTRWA